MNGPAVRSPGRERGRGDVGVSCFRVAFGLEFLEAGPNYRSILERAVLDLLGLRSPPVGDHRHALFRPSTVSAVGMAGSSDARVGRSRRLRTAPGGSSGATE